MAIHLILLAVNKVNLTLQGRAQIYSDCLGAFVTVNNLPTNRIPCQCMHSDILNNIMVNCQNLTFACSYSHVKAHQDHDMAYQYLSHPSQLNFIMDDHAKKVIWVIEGLHFLAQEIFPLGPVAIFVGNENIISNTGDSLRFWVHQQLAKELFFKLGILTPLGFKEVVWRLLYDTLHKVPRLFQLWLCKQIMNISGTNLIQSRYKPHHYRTCPSCDQCVQTCAHVLSCNEAGRVVALYQSINILDKWLNKVGTHTHLRKYILQYAKGRGGISMTDVLYGTGRQNSKLAVLQDLILLEKVYERYDI